MPDIVQPVSANVLRRVGDNSRPPSRQISRGISRQSSYCGGGESIYSVRPKLDSPDNAASINDSERAAMNANIESLKPSITVFLLAILTSFCGFMFGYDTGYISSALVIIKQDLGKTLSSGDKELITSATSLGAFVSALFAGSLADAFGRKWVIAFANVMFLTGGAMQTGAHNLWTMIVGRFIMGWGVGVASLVAPMYLSEVAPTRFRGRLVVMNVLAITFGQLVAYCIGYGLQHVSNGWRILVGLSMVPSLSQMILFVFMPETPRYLMLRGRRDAARSILNKVYVGATESMLDAKIAEIQKDVPEPAMIFESNPDHKTKIKSALITLRHNLHELFVQPANLRALAIVVGLQLLQQFCGWNALVYYSGTMFEIVNFSDPIAVSIIITATNFVFTVVAFLCIDRVGRRALLLSTIWIMGLGLVLCAIAFKNLGDVSDIIDGNADAAKQHTSGKWADIIIVFIFVFAAGYGSGIGCVPWVQSEMLPMEVRGIGTSFSTAANWAGSLIVSATFLTMFKNDTWDGPTGTFSFYAGMCFLGEILTFLFYPETAGLDLEEVQGLLQGGFRVRDSVKLSRQRKQLYRNY